MFSRLFLVYCNSFFNLVFLLSLSYQSSFLTTMMISCAFIHLFCHIFSTGKLVVYASWVTPVCVRWASLMPQQSTKNTLYLLPPWDIMTPTHRHQQELQTGEKSSKSKTVVVCVQSSPFVCLLKSSFLHNWLVGWRWG